jgi:hypothetical protein
MSLQARILVGATSLQATELEEDASEFESFITTGSTGVFGSDDATVAQNECITLRIAATESIETRIVLLLFQCFSYFLQFLFPTSFNNAIERVVLCEWWFN